MSVAKVLTHDLLVIGGIILIVGGLAGLILAVATWPKTTVSCIGAVVIIAWAFSIWLRSRTVL